ncbi:hypothetical protein LN852_004501 [Salmonella enterica]|nr:hypothetical protein [Salmonella enterica]EJY3357270.1 hypothetical protein [Salmonella enterica]
MVGLPAGEQGTMNAENMCTIRRQLWQQEDQKRAEVLVLWEADYLANRQKVSPDTVLIPEKETSASEIRLLDVGDC